MPIAWWNRLRMQTKLQILTQFFVLLVMIGAQLWIMERFEKHVFSASRDKAEAIADGVINGHNILVASGAIARPDMRALFNDMMTGTEGLLELRIIRSDATRQQFGERSEGAPTATDDETRVLKDGKAHFEAARTDDGTLAMRAIAPFIAGKNERGVNCLTCHAQAREGEVLGVASMLVNLKHDEEILRNLNHGLWIGQVVIQIILFLIIGAIARAITAPAKQLQAAMTRIEAEGDLTLRVDNASHDELGQVSRAFNKLMDSFRDIIQQIHVNTDEVTRATQALAQSTEAVIQGSSKQSTLAASVTHAAENIREGISHVASDAREAESISDRTHALSLEGRDVTRQSAREIEQIAERVRQARETIQMLGERSARIDGIVTSIKQIADQTNLLALNAAIEAARAGEHGRGFAVVSDEVRALASRTAQATNEISAMTQAIQRDTELSVDSMEQAAAQMRLGVELGARAADSLDQINQGASRTEQHISAIAKAMNEQTTASIEIAESMHNMAHMATENAEIIGKTSSAIDNLEKLAQELNQRVLKFKA
ncbi:MAG: methyl-accepting chemotaxis protein [Pseudomonadota bacterium]